MNAQTVNQATKAGTAKAEREHLATLEKVYLRLIRAAGRRAAEAFTAQTALVAAVNPKWVPPTAQLIDAEQLTADAQRKTARPHELILRDVTAADEIGITWDINHPTSQQLLANVASRLESLNAALRLQVSETIQDGYAQGWSVARTAAAIVEKVDEVAPGRAETYARTDLVALSNGGSLMAAQIVGVAAKTWLTAGDDKVRESHAAAEGQTVGLEQPFDIGGEQGMFPGDPDLSDENAFNCRCTITYGDDLTAAATESERTSVLLSAAADPLPFWRDCEMELMNVTRDEYDALVAAASGSTSLPLSAQDAKWDAGAARKTLEPGQFAKAHFWRDPAGDPDLIGSYKLPFAEVVDGKLTAIWRGVTAGAARLDQTDIPAADKKAVQAKMGAYYGKAKTKFADPSITAPWDDGKASGDAAALSALREIAPGLETLTDDEILGFRSIIFAAMKKHDYRGDGGACAVCGELASNKDAHYEAKTEKLTVELADIALTAAVGEATAWQATMLVEGVPTEDGRLIANGAVTWRALPLPIGLMLETPHSDIVEAPVCGRIDQIWRAGSLIQASGIFNDNVDDPEMRATGLQAVEAVENRIVKGVSVDLLVLADEVIFVPDENDEGDDSGDGAGGDGMDIIDSGPVQEAPVMIDMPDGRWLYVVTEGVIGSACVVPVPAIAQGQIQVVTADASHVFERIEFVTPLFHEDSLVAAVAPIRPPAGWFQNPKLTEPTPLTITDDGQVYGHVALWSSCHQGFPGRCVPPPRSNTGYSMFHVGAIKTDEGQTLAIGKITLKAPHADVALNSAAARAHYDNTGTVAAFVRAGEDEFGPWVAGALRSDASEEIVRDLLANPLSGDWRGGEMIAAHAVPAPGFPVLRASVVDDSGDEIETALILTSPLATFRPAAKAIQAAQEALEAEQERVAPLAYLRPGKRAAA